MRPRIAALTAVCVGFGLAAGVLPAAGTTATVVPAAPATEVLDPTTGERPTDRGSLRSLGEAPGAQDEAELPAPESVLVRFVDGAGEEQQRSALGALDAPAADDVAGTGFVEVPLGDEEPADVVARLEADPLVAEVQLDHVRSAAAWTNDPLVEFSWPYLDLTRLPRAWDMSTGTGTVVAVLDTGVDATHPDLAGSIEPGIDLVNRDADPADDHGHGTIVAGAAMAHGNNGQGAVGAAYGARLLPVKVLDGRGRGNDSVVAEGIAWAVDHGADVLNLSLGGSDVSPVLLAAMRAAVARGVVVVVAAGNDGSDVAQYPAAYAPQVAGVLAVGATDDDGALMDFSSWGDWVSIAAPGLMIVGPAPGGGYKEATGTSLAAPLVSGTAALVLARTPGATPAVVEDRLVSTARDAGPRGVDPFYGRGVLDAAAAVDGPARTVAPAVPLDRATGDAGPEDGTMATATRITAATNVTATLSPEGDEDWYRYDVPAAGWYDVMMAPKSLTNDGHAPDFALEVRDAAGHVLAVEDAYPQPLYHETARIPVTAPGPIWIRAHNANGSAGWQPYGLSVEAHGTRTLFTQTAAPSNWWESGLVLADVTGDGRADAVLPRPQPEEWGGATSIAVAAGRADGTLAPLVDVPTGTPDLGKALVTADVDGDGDADVVTSTSSGIVVLAQAGGTLTPRPATPTGFEPGKLDAADIDGDTDVDLLVAGGGVRTVHLNDGTGSFRPGVVAKRGDGPFALGDVTGDGRVDIVEDTQVFAQTASGEFATPVVFSDRGDRSYRNVVVRDMDGDGLNDVVRCGPSVDVFRQTAEGTLVPVVEQQLHWAGACAVGDLDRDGRPDVVTEGIEVLLQDDRGRLTVQERQTFEDNGSREAVALGDVDGDSFLDAALGGGGIVALRQIPFAVTGAVAWVEDLSPAPHTAGLGLRPTAGVTLGRDVAPGSVTAATARLVDGTTGADVDVARAYDAATGRLSLTPRADLVGGRHYEVLVTGLTDTAGDVLTDVVRTWFTVAADGDRFTAVDPVRVLDSRNGTGVPAGVLEEDEVVELWLGGKWVPREATAVVLNVTATQAAGPGNVRVFPTRTGHAPPGVSNLNIVRSVDQPNLVTVALGDDGYVSLLSSNTRTHLVADLAGYYTAGGGTAYVPVTPVRALDTRNGTGGVPASRIRAGRWVDLVVTGRNGVPADASAVVLNVTATNVQRETHVRVVPAPAASESQELPNISSLNLYPGRDQANLVTVRVGDGGRVRLYTHGSDLDLIADLAGYYTPTGDHGYVPLTPDRIADTRRALGLPGGPLATGVPATLAVGGVAGVPLDAGAVVLNVTAAGPRGRTHVRVFPTTVPATLPDISNLNLVPGRDEPNMVIVRLGDAGRVSFYTANERTDLVVDVSGYFRR
ncbi:S8 family serine peptidase [Cellulomonas cellasea]|uniref:Subtilisin family serine protease n=1 Tax=Cellulomonas cellasea TaxID=43670 RepID=A0A7W4UJJ5_9CELL|nr:S8 family serine peptidase [Cellulomonas cellasea]MBB2924708.1 subtilisin family serine protease [Cellulomonas cellasea]